MKLIDRPVLVLNKSWIPIRIITVKRACTLVFAEKASIILPSDYSLYNWNNWLNFELGEGEIGIEMVHGKMKLPEVIVLLKFNKANLSGVKLTKRNLYIRDSNVCQYSGKKISSKNADIDHILPKSRGGKTSWENMVVCSKEINRLKGNKTPEEAGLKLIKKPEKPIYTKIMLDPKLNVPSSWTNFLQHGN
jgi:hypothetical protein